MSFVNPKVLCGVPCGKIPPYDAFYDCLAGLRMPEGSRRKRVVGEYVSQNLNELVDTAFEYKFTHLFIVEDDSFFEPDTLMKLLAHDKPVISGVCRSRTPPFVPFIYSEITNDGFLKFRHLTPEDRGLIRVGATGMGGILINMEVFKHLSRPYFSIYYENETLWGQDIIFGKELIKAGIEVYCDTDVIIEHMTQCLIGTEFIEGRWLTVIRIGEAKVYF